ncbi:hypothetical protein OBBRIDRAFT_127473 [Obba rivulosa]|uniref:Secreted protein n=1 Tax=Obba rivulosa TaxID=1052685 RepID=A0A8E2DIC9_9APHY|nr:hypothetical protein OBBRIDRAFT_127473 [Obba rivulosa]
MQTGRSSQAICVVATALCLIQDTHLLSLGNCRSCVCRSEHDGGSCESSSTVVQLCGSPHQQTRAGEFSERLISSRLYAVVGRLTLAIGSEGDSGKRVSATGSKLFRAWVLQALEKAQVLTLDANDYADCAKR